MSTARDSRRVDGSGDECRMGKANRPNKPNGAKRQTHKRHDGYKRYGSLFCLSFLL